MSQSNKFKKQKLMRSLERLYANKYKPTKTVLGKIFPAEVKKRKDFNWLVDIIIKLS